MHHNNNSNNNNNNSNNNNNNLMNDRPDIDDRSEIIIKFTNTTCLREFSINNVDQLPLKLSNIYTRRPKNCLYGTNTNNNIMNMTQNQLGH